MDNTKVLQREVRALYSIAEAINGSPNTQELLPVMLERTVVELEYKAATLRLLDEENPPAVSWLFDTLAGEITERLGLEVPERKPRPFLI